MRAQELLSEYNRDITAQRLGRQVYDVFSREGSGWQRRAIGRDVTNDAPEDVIETLLKYLENADPTANKKYMPWLARTYAKGGTRFEDVLGQVSTYLEKFDALNQRKKLPAPRNDINRYADFGDFMSVMDEYEDPSQVELKDKGEATELYNDENIRVIVPENQTAACYYGQGTRWCTAATRGQNYFLNYSNQAPLMIVIPKHPSRPGEKYQLWFFYGVDNNLFTSDAEANDYYQEYGDDFYADYGQFMDEQDDEVDLGALMRRFGNSLHNAVVALEKKFPALDYAIQANYQNEGLA
jgi:hypothetical protein